MSEEQDNKCTALVPYDGGALATRKRRELEESLEAEKVRDPISLLVTAGISLAISAATTAASYLLSRAFAPKPKPIERGRTTGQLVISSQLGILIPEAYFGDPGDGLGGTWLPAIVISLEPIAKQVNVSRQEVGGGKGGGGQTQEVHETVYFFPYLALMYGKGPLRALKLKNNSDVVFDLYGEVSTYEGEAASVYTAPTQVSSYEGASGGKEITLQSANPATSAVQWNNVQSNGAATRQLTITYRTDESSPMSIDYTVNGGAPVAIVLPTTNESFMQHTVPVSLNDGANTFKIKNKSITKNLGIDRIYCFPGHTTATATTGILNPVVPVDAPYNPELPPNPALPYTVSFDRFDAVADVDEFATQTGTVLHGGTFALYEGNDEQLPDPTMQAAIDALHGADSTPAYRGRAYEVDANLYLTRWGNAIPNKTGLWEHVVIKTLAQFCGHMCSRVSIASADSDFSALDSILPRGLRMLGQRFEAREPMTQAATLFNVFFTEEDFLIKGKLQGGASVATLTDEDFGWIEGDEIPEALSSIDIPEPDATTLPARVEVKHLDLDRDGDPGLQGYGRHETIGVEPETLDFSDWTLVADEAQEVTQRVTYQRYVEKPLKFVVSWKYVWFTAGDVFTANLDSGFSYEIQIDKITGGVGIQECEGHLVDTPVYTQPVSTGSGGFGAPVVPIPQMTIAALMDTPLLRDRDETENNGVGFYAAATPRTGDGVWNGASLYVFKVGWERIADFTLPATMGRQVLANGSGVALPTGSVYVFDNTNTVTVDLYGTTHTLSSASESDVLNGQNACLIGDEVIQFMTAAQVGGQPNRWTLSGLLRGRRGTEYATTTHVLNERFVFLNEAVKFVPMNALDLNSTYDYTMVSNGASLDDAAIIEDFTWTGKSKQPLSIINHRGTRDSANSLLIEFEGRTRVGGGFRSYQAGAINEEEELYKVQILNAGSTVLPNGKERIMDVYVGTPMAAVLTSDIPSKYGNIIGNSVVEPPSSFDDTTATAFQLIEKTGNFVEGKLSCLVGNGERACLGVAAAGIDWRERLHVDINTASHIFIVYESSTPPTLNIYEYGVNKYNLVSPGNSIYRISFAGTELRVYRNWTGASGEMVYSSSKPMTFPYRVIARTETDEAIVGNIMMTTRPFPKTIYSWRQQREDFVSGGEQPSVQMDIWQQSRLFGPGEKSRVTL